MRASIRLMVLGFLLVIFAVPVAALAQATHAFNLPAQGLADSLRELGSQAQVNVIFDPAVVKGHEAPAIKGNYEPKQALAKLLAGSGFTAEFTSANTVVIKPAPATAAPGPPSRSRSSRAQRAAAAPEPTTMDKITVLGSLIPRSQIETASPLIVVTAQDIKERGFSSVADALQNLSVNTGTFNNTAIKTGDLWAAKTISLFGLDPSYTKFLIDGRPMPLFSQMAQNKNSDQLYTSLSGIPIDLVERIEILPGGQSSLYGSDAIAGVVNIVLKKHVNVGTVDARMGFYSDGGGRERMLSFTNSFAIGKLNLMVGAQLGDQQPLWAFQRRFTAQNFAGGINPQLPNQNIYVQGLFTGLTYFPAQPSDCDAFKHLWGGSEKYYADDYGAYCGSVSSSAYGAMINKSRTANLGVHANYAVNDRLELYADLLDDYQEQAHKGYSGFFDMFDDPNLQDLVMVQRDFAPEEMANSLDGLLTQKNYENTYQATFGGKGDLGRGWNLDVAFTRSVETNNDRQNGMRYSQSPDSYVYAVLGPQLGIDDYGYPIYEPNYSLLTQVLTPAQYASYLGAASINSSDRNDQLRAQLTQTSLFHLPGGDAGLAVVAEEGFESWKYLPDPLLTSGGLQGLSWTTSGGHRTRYATAAELNLPLFKMLTADLSARYDSYDAEGAHFSKPTYSVGLEFRPWSTLLLRGKYSTSFKAPSLIDQFEGGSSGTGFVTDWVNCARLGFDTPADCPFPYNNELATIIDTSNPHLQPLTARNFSYGVVWSPSVHLSMSVDYQHISIHNEVLKENPDYLLQTQLYCSDGTLDPNSPTCQAANAQIIRAPAPPGSPLLGQIVQVTATKINIAKEVNNAINASFNYRTDPHAWGYLDFSLGYTRVLAHRQQQFPGDPLIDFLNNPGFSTELHTKANATLTWTRKKWSATLFGTYFGPIPNYAAYASNGYSAPYAAKLPPWRIYNASVDYSPVPAWRLSLRVNNIKNSMPPIDVTYPSYTNLPFNSGNYNPYGREVFVEARYQFGHGKD